ncbi:MAG TPA: Crp/Fnr family transcriptional regulator [Pyrinomonadaceae bacterium]
MNQPQNPQHLMDNRILTALPAGEYERLLPHLEEVRMNSGDTISRPGEEIKHVYFPKRGIISICAMMEDGTQVEVGVIGNEGMFGLPILFKTSTVPLQAMVQIPDGAVRMSAEAFIREVEQCEHLRNLLLHYAQAFFMQTAQTAACNRLHPMDGRLARWLLMCQDRTRSDVLQLTHEFIAIMLGVRRAGVSTAAAKLRDDKVIDYQRGFIRILDRKGLEAISCECYGVVRKEFDRLLAPDGHAS